MLFLVDSHRGAERRRPPHGLPSRSWRLAGPRWLWPSATFAHLSESNDSITLKTCFCGPTPVEHARA